MAESHLFTEQRVIRNMADIEESDFEYPVEVRPSFTLRGKGHALAYDRFALDTLLKAGLDASATSEVLLTYSKPEPTASEKREARYKELLASVFAKQRELGGVTSEYQALGVKRASLIAQVSALQLKLTELNQEIDDG